MPSTDNEAVSIDRSKETASRPGIRTVIVGVIVLMGIVAIMNTEELKALFNMS